MNHSSTCIFGLYPEVGLVGSGFNMLHHWFGDVDFGVTDEVDIGRILGWMVHYAPVEHL